MKKCLCSAALFSLFTLPVHAQISAGTKLFTGSIGYRHQTNEANQAPESLEKVKQFSFAPAIGYFVSENLILGVNGTIDLYNRQNNGMELSFDDYVKRETKEKRRTLGAGVFGRYYKFMGDKFALYGQVGLGYQNYTSSSTYQRERVPVVDRNDWRSEQLYGQILPGIVFFPTQKLGLELSMRGASYNITTNTSSISQDTERKSTHNTFNLGFGLNDLRLGISLYLGRN